MKECEADPELPATWDATSDAIAVRLAERLGYLPVVFIKSRKPGGNEDPQSLANEGLIDPVSATLLKRSGLPFAIIEATETSRLSELLLTPETVDEVSGA